MPPTLSFCTNRLRNLSSKKSASSCWWHCRLWDEFFKLGVLKEKEGNFTRKKGQLLGINRRFWCEPPPQWVWPWSWKWWQLQRHGVNASSSPKSTMWAGDRCPTASQEDKAARSLILEVWINFLLSKVTVKMKLASGLLGPKSLLMALPFASGPIKLHLCRLAALGAAWVSGFFYNIASHFWVGLPCF